MKRLLLISLLLIAVPAFAYDSIEVVESVPLETDLGVTGVRQTQEVWLEMIRGASQTIDLEQFYISDQKGEALAPVLDALVEAATARNVHIRLIVDSKFYKEYPQSVDRLGSTRNIESRVIDYGAIAGGVQHSKYFVVDGHNSFVGSQNFDWRALSHIHEIGLRVVDADIGADLERVFETDWALAGGGRKATLAKTTTANVERQPLSGVDRSHLRMDGAAADTEVRVVAAPAKQNPSGIGYSADAITGLIGEARQSVRIQVMEYTTKGSGQVDTQSWRVLDTAIRAAAAKGVHVELMVDVSDVKKAKKDLASLASLKNVEVRAVTIPEWSGGKIDYARLIHSKYLVVDDSKAWVGSENWSRGYFLETRDVGLVVRVPEVASQLAGIYDKLWNSRYATAAGVQNSP